MEVLQKGVKGDRKDPNTPKWVGHMVYCPCGFQTRLEEKDKGIVTIEQNSCSLYSYIICPTCVTRARTF